ncbi:hypothetical protein Glove_219g49 [Diversispora epigaea]|uniref:Uncharacterized protein n=1 Tax=Diversispora epigaea TaxID=1348612 RepID=A0A397IQ55_9GLOM|nr:hypothetical protein Glove_219g49 [Diversispora epigaea]
MFYIMYLYFYISFLWRPYLERKIDSWEYSVYAHAHTWLMINAHTHAYAMIKAHVPSDKTMRPIRQRGRKEKLFIKLHQDRIREQAQEEDPVKNNEENNKLQKVEY